MQTQSKCVNANFNDVEIFDLNIRLQFITLFHEEGSVHASFTYDIHQEWEEYSEGGYVVNSGYLYYPKNIKLTKIRDEYENIVDFLLTEKQIEYITNYIYDEIYEDQNNA